MYYYTFFLIIYLVFEQYIIENILWIYCVILSYFYSRILHITYFIVLYIQYYIYIYIIYLTLNIQYCIIYLKNVDFKNMQLQISYIKLYYITLCYYIILYYVILYCIVIYYIWNHILYIVNWIIFYHIISNHIISYYIWYYIHIYIYYIHHLAGTAPKYFALTCCGCQSGVHGHLGRQRAIGAGLHGQRAAGVEAIPAKPQSEGAEPGVWCRLFGIFLGPRLWKTGGTIEVSDLSRDNFFGKLSEASSKEKNIRNPGKDVNVWATQNRVETKNVENLQLSSKQKCQKIQGRCAPKGPALKYSATVCTGI